MFFLKQKQRDKEDIFQKIFENTDEWQNVFLRSCMEDGFTAKSGKNQEKTGFSKRLRKESMSFDVFRKQNDFWKKHKKKIGRRKSR